MDTSPDAQLPTSAYGLLESLRAGLGEKIRKANEVSPHGLPGNEFDQIGYRTVRAFQHHALTLQLSQDTIPRHQASPNEVKV